MPRLACLLALALLSAAVQASPSPAGLWQGRIGKQDAVACFNADGSGLYYYLKHDNDLVLNPEGHNTWREESLGSARLTGRWTLNQISAETLEGDWTTSKGKSATPIRLARLALVDKSSGKDACSDAAFLQPRLLALPREAGAVQDTGGLRWQEVSAFKGAVSGVRLIETQPSPLGQALEKRLDESLAARFECRAGVADRESGSRDMWSFESHEKLLHVSPAFVVLAWNSDDDCGGAHPNSNDGAVVLDRRTGAEIKPETWYRPPYAKDIPAGSALGKLLIAPYRKGEPECLEAVRQSFGWVSWPTPAGMVFQPELPHVATGCVNISTLPWKAVAPFLSEPGQQLMREFAPR